MTGGDYDQVTVDEGRLGRRDRLNSGANGAIWRLTGFQLASAPGPLVYKQYQGQAAVGVSLAGLASIVQARLRLTPRQLTVFDELTVWPLRVVVDRSGTPLGVLMRLIDSDFMENMRLPSGRRAMVPREVQHLIFDPAVARRNSVDVPADRDLAARFTVCERMALAMSLMHGANLVYGDLSSRNVLYRLRPKPSVLLVDCDAARVKGSAAVNKQQNSPDWDAPEGGQQTQASDRYKLALFVLRCLLPGRNASLNRDPASAAAVLKPEGRRLMRMALTGPPSDRPLAREWLSYLRQEIGLQPLPSRQSTGVVKPKDGGQRIPVQNTPGWLKGDDGVWVRT
ncbi:hypothetical protein [Luedemannella helvata]|uniref:Protein kinase domain-containing protein n=1 Tax=Luedemannella helvata TaxID=349315 RepID=A0ABP4VWT1_9ACTN